MRRRSRRLELPPQRWYLAEDSWQWALWLGLLSLVSAFAVTISCDPGWVHLLWESWAGPLP